MKNKNLYLITMVSTILFSSLIGRGLSTSAAKVNDVSGNTPTQSVMNINNMAYWITSDGAYTTSGSPNGTMADYPIFTGGLIYSDGMLWGAKVNEDGDASTPTDIRVGGSTYAHGMKAGRAIYVDNVLKGADDPAMNHVWRVRKDWATGDLTRDAANYYKTSPGEVTADQILAVKTEYEEHWMGWPAAWGAPYENNDGVDGYDPSNGDIPGYPGADQTLWTVANDIPTIVNAAGDSVGTLDTAPTLYGADAIGIELQITMWAYAYGADAPLGNIVFKGAKMKYVGLPGGSADASMDSVYFTQWSDPDLGTYTDDYVGCDIDLSFGYVYNGNRLDGVFNGIYNLPVPAGGYDFLQGPVDNLDINKNDDSTEFLGMTAFTYFGAGSAIADPDLASYEGSLQFFNLMEGYLPRPAYPQQVPSTDLATGLETKFLLSGDPVTGSGWVDGVQLPPGDRRLVMASGPFEMKLNDEAEVVLALAGGTGLDNVSSVSVAKFHDLSAQYAYDQGFSLPNPPTPPKVVAIEEDKSVTLDFGYDEVSVSAIEGTISSGFEFEGYNVYQLANATTPLSEGVKVATYDKINTVLNILDNAVDPSTGLVVQVAKQTGTNSGVQRYFTTDYDELRGRPMSNGITYTYAVTAYTFLSENEGSPFKQLESGATIIQVRPHGANPGFTAAATSGSDIVATQTGTANASISVNVINPEGLTGDEYEVYFTEQVYELNLNGTWSEVAESSAAKVADLDGTTVVGAAASSQSVGTIDVSFQINVVSPDYNYADGVQLTFPEGTIINSATSGAIAMISEVNPNVVMFGDNSLSTGGFFAGGEVVTVNIPTPAGFPNTPIDVDWIVYDDGWATAWCTGDNVADCANCDTYSIGVGCDGTVYTETADASGQVSVSELSLFVQTEKHWNLGNKTTNTVLLEKQTFVGGKDVWNGASAENKSMMHYNDAAALTTEGFHVNVNGGYAAPDDFSSFELTASATVTDEGDASYDIDSYLANGWAATAKAVDTYGSGITSVDFLQRDIQIRFTGEFVDEPTTLDDGTVYYAADTTKGGSYAWFSGARGYDIANHPANPTGEEAPFRIAVPFEAWDMEAIDADGNPIEGGQQIDIEIYDRVGALGDTLYSFNPYGRMYTHFIHRPYAEDGGDNTWEDYLTWNLVWWDAQFNQGDVISFSYANPIQIGQDVFSFATTKSSVVNSDNLNMVSVYPNPYYGFHELEANRSDKYVSFNNLPVETKIDIYSLGGVFVKSIDKTDASQFAQWDLKNQYGYPVASGVYIARITAGSEEKILKIALVQETQVLKYY